MRAIFKRELQGYFYTAAAYVYMGVFLTLGCVFFAINNLAARSSDLNNLLWMMSYLWMLLTSPVSLWGVVGGKFLAACAVLLCSVALSLVFVLIVALYGQVYPQELAVGYLGFILQGCAFIALDMLISAQCRAPMTAAIVAFGGNLLLWLMDVLNAAIDIKIVNSILTFISPYQRCAPFKLGQLSFANALYFVAAIFLCLFFSVRTLDARRWREA